jgi:Concanavalin A-like lectin/glucanases superfamily
MLTQRTDMNFNRVGLSPLPNILPYPLQLGALLKGWFSADNNIVLSGSNVSSWTDRTTNAIHVTPQTSPQPIVYTAIAQNGLPGLQTAQTTNTNATAAVLFTGAPIPALAIDWNLPVSFSMAMKAGSFTGTTNVQPLVHYSTTSPNGLFGYYSNWNGNISVRIVTTAGASIQLTGQAMFAVNTTVHVTFTYDGSGTTAGMRFYVNGLLVTTGSGGTPITTGSCNGATSALRLFSGFQSGLTAAPDMLFEVVFTGAALTAAQVLSMDTYLNAKWALHA